MRERLSSFQKQLWSLACGNKEDNVFNFGFRNNRKLKEMESMLFLYRWLTSPQAVPEHFLWSVWTANSSDIGQLQVKSGSPWKLWGENRSTAHAWGLVMGCVLQAQGRTGDGVCSPSTGERWRSCRLCKFNLVYVESLGFICSHICPSSHFLLIISSWQCRPSSKRKEI